MDCESLLASRLLVRCKLSLVHLVLPENPNHLGENLLSGREMNFFKNRVSFPTLSVVIALCCFSISFCAERPYLAIFGLKEIPFGSGYQFKNLYKVRIKFDVNISDFPEPETLDCERYGLKKQSTEEEPAYASSRRKRSVDETFRMDGLTICQYRFDPRDRQMMIDSEKEEEFWQEQVMTGKREVFCDSGFGENCLLRRIHMPNFTVSWYRRYLFREKRFLIEPSYVIYNPPKRVAISKEIMYRSESLIASATKGQLLDLSYECLGDPYKNQSKFLRYDRAIYHLQQQVMNLIYANPGRSVISNFSSRVPLKSSKKIITAARTVVDQRVPEGLQEDQILEYGRLNEEIKKKLNLLTNLESKVDKEITKLENYTSFEESKSQIVEHCRLWLHEKQNTLEIYKERYKLIASELNVDEHVSIEMEPDLRVVCAEASFIRQQRNALIRIDKLNEDRIAREILSLLGFHYVVDSKDNYKIANKLDRFKNLGVYDSIKMDFIAIEAQKLKLQQRIDEMDSEIGNLKVVIETNDNVIEQIKKRIRSVSEEVEKDQIQLDKLNATTKTLYTKKSQMLTAITDVQRRLLSGLSSLKRTRPTTRGFIIPHSFSVVNRTETRKRHDEAIALQTELNTIKLNISTMANLTLDYVNLLRLSNQTLEDLKMSLAANQTLEEENVNRLEYLSENARNFEEKLEATTREYEKVHGQINLDSKRSIVEERPLKEANSPAFRQTSAPPEAATIRAIAPVVSSTATSRPRTLANVIETTTPTPRATIPSYMRTVSVTAPVLPADGLDSDSNADLTNESKPVPARLRNLETDVGSILKVIRRVTRDAEIEKSMGANIKKYCESVNEKLRDVIKNMKAESDRTRVPEMRKRRQTLVGSAWRAAKTAFRYGAAPVEAGFRYSETQVLQNSLVKAYGEYLNHTQLDDEWKNAFSQANAKFSENLDTLNKYLTSSTAQMRDLISEVNRIKYYGIANRLWILFTSDVFTVHRILLNYLQKNAVQMRILESIYTLKSGFLSADFIDEVNLKRILSETQKQLQMNEKLAFGEESYDFYYKFPVSGLYMENEQRFIELFVPIIHTKDSPELFELIKLKTHPFYCPDREICGSGTFEANLKHDVLFYDREGILRGTASSSELECMLYWDRKLCWLVDEKLRFDSCIRKIYGKENAIKDFCLMTRTDELVPEIRINRTELYRTFVNEEGISAGKIIDTRTNKGSGQITNVYAFLGNDTKALSTEMFGIYDYKEPDDYGLVRERITELDSRVRAEHEFYRNRTVMDFVRETKLDTISTRSKHWNPNKSKLSWMKKWMQMVPYLIFATILILNNGWFLLGPICVITKIRGTHAAFESLKRIKEAYEWMNDWTEWWKTLPDRLNMLWEKSLNSLGLIIIVVLLAYIVYHTLVRRIEISCFYARKRSSNKTKAWYLIASSIVESKRWFSNRREYISVAVELDANERDWIFTAMAHNCWLKDKSASNLLLAIPIELHTLKEDHILTSTRTINLRVKDLEWNAERAPNLDRLNGRSVAIKLALLSDSHGRTKLNQLGD